MVKYFDLEVHGTLKNAEHIDQNGLFVRNHHYPIPEAFVHLRDILYFSDCSKRNQKSTSLTFDRHSLSGQG